MAEPQLLKQILLLGKILNIVSPALPGPPKGGVYGHKIPWTLGAEYQEFITETASKVARNQMDRCLRSCGAGSGTVIDQWMRSLATNQSGLVE